MHRLVSELHDRLHCHYLPGFNRPARKLHIMRGQAHEVAREAAPLLLNALSPINFQARFRRFFIGVRGIQQGDHRLLRFKVNGIPFSLLWSKLAADVEGAGNIHGFMVEVCTVIKDHEPVGRNLFPVIE